MRNFYFFFPHVRLDEDVIRARRGERTPESPLTPRAARVGAPPTPAVCVAFARSRRSRSGAPSPPPPSRSTRTTTSSTTRSRPRRSGRPRRRRTSTTRTRGWTACADAPSTSRPRGRWSTTRTAASSRTSRTCARSTPRRGRGSGGTRALRRKTRAPKFRGSVSEPKRRRGGARKRVRAARRARRRGRRRARRAGGFRGDPRAHVTRRAGCRVRCRARDPGADRAGQSRARRRRQDARRRLRGGFRFRFRFRYRRRVRRVRRARLGVVRGGPPGSVRLLPRLRTGSFPDAGTIRSIADPGTYGALGTGTGTRSRDGDGDPKGFGGVAGVVAERAAAAAARLYSAAFDESARLEHSVAAKHALVRLVDLTLEGQANAPVGRYFVDPNAGRHGEGGDGPRQGARAERAFGSETGGEDYSASPYDASFARGVERATSLREDDAEREARVRAELDLANVIERQGEAGTRKRSGETENTKTLFRISGFRSVRRCLHEKRTARIFRTCSSNSAGVVCSAARPPHGPDPRRGAGSARRTPQARRVDRIPGAQLARRARGALTRP